MNIRMRHEAKARRTIFWFALCALLLAIGFSAEAQQPKKVPRIGFLGAASATSQASRLDAFRQGLRDLGYVEGKSIIIEYRDAEGKFERLPKLAAELVGLKVDIIVTQGSPAVEAAKKTTSTIPIVMATGGDAVGSGLVASLARPGGNITGLSTLATDLAAKRLELLKEVVPKASLVAILLNPANATNPLQLKEIKAAAPALGVILLSVEVKGADDLETAFTAIRKNRAGGIIVLSDPMLGTHRRRIAEFTVKSRLPAIYPGPEFVDAGGLMSYGNNFDDLFRRAATYVDKILKGAKPADLPVEQPMKFEFIVNLKTAKQIGITISQSVLYRADKVIK
jgi:putative tryptophan/tyrosine transport system substrate-binding protein